MTAARFYGVCPLRPGASVTVHRWLLSPQGWLVLLEFVDENGVRWKGPEYPLHLAGDIKPLHAMDQTRRLIVRTTTIDAIEAHTLLQTEDAP